jgi:ferredoxin
MKIEVNATECRGYAICVGIAPAYFELDDEGIAVVPHGDVDPSDEDQVREAALVCPTLAIRVTD